MSCTNDCRKPSGAMAHCGVCHRTWSVVRGFDRHRRNGQCLDPATLGFTESDRVWRQPISEKDRARLQARRQKVADSAGHSPVTTEPSAEV